MHHQPSRRIACRKGVAAGLLDPIHFWRLLHTPRQAAPSLRPFEAGPLGPSDASPPVPDQSIDDAERLRCCGQPERLGRIAHADIEDDQLTAVKRIPVQH
jgi:hypothetical protein